MGKAFDECKYAQLAEELIDFMIDNRDDARNHRGEIDILQSPYISAPSVYIKNRKMAAPAWRTFDNHLNGWRLFMHENAQIVQAIMYFVEMVMSNDTFVKFRPKAKFYIAAVEQTVEAFDASFVYQRFPKIPGSYYYPSIDGHSLYNGAVEYNMNASMGTTLLLLDKAKGGVPEYRRKAEAIAGYFMAHVQLKSDDAYIWHYHPQKPWIGLTSSGIEDFSHAHVDIGFHIMAYKCGLGFTRLDMQRFSNTLVKRIYLGDGELAWSVDGQEINSIKKFSPIGFDWISLCEFNPEILSIAITVYKKHYPKPSWSWPFLGWANILYWKKILNPQ